MASDRNYLDTRESFNQLLSNMRQSLTRVAHHSIKTSKLVNYSVMLGSGLSHRQTKPN